MYDTLLSFFSSSLSPPSSLSSFLVSDMGLMDATSPLPLPFSPSPEEVAATIKKDLQETLFPSL